MTKPFIGITTSYENNRQSVDVHYADAVERAGGIPIILPIIQHKATAQEFANILDGLVITGGPGITRGLVGKLPDDLPPVDPLRDASDELEFSFGHVGVDVRQIFRDHFHTVEHSR